MTSFPASRASQAREALQRARDEWDGGTLRGAIPYVDALKLIPEGALILLPDEVEQVRVAITDLLEMIALERGGGTPVVSEEYLARRDFARHVLNRVVSGGAGEGTK